MRKLELLIQLYGKLNIVIDREYDLMFKVSGCKNLSTRYFDIETNRMRDKVLAAKRVVRCLIALIQAEGEAGYSTYLLGIKKLQKTQERYLATLTTSLLNSCIASCN